jgi:hypothetical protein
VLESLFGNPNIERVLFYLQRFGEGYPSAIAANFEVPLTPIQQQLNRLEQGSLVVSRLVGKTRVFKINPRYPFKRELEALLATAFKAMPAAQIDKYYMQRTRPRRQGKP